MRFMTADVLCTGARAEVRRSVMAGSTPRFRLAHIEVCSGCQAEAIEYRELKANLASLRTETIDAPVGLVSTVLTHLDEALPVRGTVRRVSKTVAVSAASAAAALATAIIVARRRAASTA